MSSCRSVWPSAVGIWWATIAMYGQGATSTIVLPPVNLSSTETAKLNIMSAAAGYPGWSSVTTCQAVVTFYRRDGSIIGEAGTFSVGSSSQVFSAELPYASAGLQASPDVVSTDVTLTAFGGAFSTPSPPIPPCAVVFSLETFDSATGVSHIVVPGQAEENGSAVTNIGAVSTLPCLATVADCDLLYAFERTPSLIIVIPPVGLSSTETLEIDIRNAAAGYANSSAGACSGSVTFYGPDGSALASPTSGTLEKTAQSFSAQLPYALVGTKIPRPAISAQISLTAMPTTTAPPAVPPCITAFSAKTYDTATGVTHAYMAGQSVPYSVSASTTGSSSTPTQGRRR